MPTDRLSVVLREIVEADVDGSSSLVNRVCTAAVSLLSLKGAGLSLMVDGELCGTAGVSEPGIALVQELQLTLGEGPCVDAWTNRAPVLEANLADPAIVRWPAFAHAGVDAGVLAVFAFPLHLGAIRIGVLVLYRGHSGMLNADEMAYGLVLADMATQVLLALQAGAPADVLHEVLAGEPSHWAEVHQATGMVSVQLGVSLDEAFVRLRAHAFAEELPLRTVAREIVMRRYRFQEPM
jgi:GAF domain/ANTAR domain